MATRPTTKTKRAAARNTARAARPPRKTSAIGLLKQDHREVEGYFEQYEKLEDEAAKTKLATKICMTLKVHTQIEEEIFYPAARKATEDNDLLDEALVEHAGAKNLIAEIEAMTADEDLYDAKVKVLGEQIHHHVEEEEDELFPEVEKSDMDLESVGKRMAERKNELVARTGMLVK